MASYDLTEVHRVTVRDEPTSSIFFNRSIDWEDERPSGARAIADLSIFSIGLFLNTVVLVAILANRRMHTSIGCYTISITISNFVILLNVLDDVLRDLFAIEIKLDIDFVGRVTLQTSSMTLVILALDRYIAICRRGTDWHRSTRKASTAVKGVLAVWSYATVATAMELHLYDHFRTRTIINIFCWSTAMYVLLPTIVIALLSVLIAMEISDNREIEASKRTGNDLENLRLFGKLAIGYFRRFARSSSAYESSEKMTF